MTTITNRPHPGGHRSRPGVIDQRDRDWPGATRRRRDRERGSATLETAILFPLFIVLSFGLIQVGLWAFGRNVCQTAAEQGAAAGSVWEAGPATAEEAGRDFAASTGHGLIRDPTVHVDQTATTITVTVDADVLTFLPGFPSHVSQTATLPKERRT